jgi:glutaconate CoA-transferase, subunit A
VTRLALDAVADSFRDGMRIGLGGFWFVRTPMALVDRLLESGVTELEIVCFGGGLGVERLLQQKRVAKLYFSFHSMDVIGPAPQFRAAVEQGEVEAVELTTHVLAKALQAAQENLPFLPVRGPLGSAFLEGPFPLPAVTCPHSGTELRAVPALPLDVALIHATAADDEGNIEIVGAHGVDPRLVGAAAMSIVSVERIGGSFRGPDAAHRTTIPRFLVDHVVEAPGGARPSSCLPHYPTDFVAIQEAVGGRSAHSPSVHPGRRQAMTSRTQASDPQAPTSAEMLVYHLAQQLRDGGVYTVGSVTPVSMVAYQLAKHTHAPSLALIPFAGLVDVRPYPVGVATAEAKALSSATAFWGMDDLYEKLYAAGTIDAEVFCPAQVDGEGRLNNSLIRRDGGITRLPGQAGIADVATLHRNLFLYVPRHSPRRLVEAVDFPGGSRHILDDEARRSVGLQPGETTVVTDLCTLRFDKVERRFELMSLHPGVSLERVLAETGFELAFELPVPTSAVPDGDTLRLIREVVDPMGVRDLETVPSAERAPLLARLLAMEKDMERHGDGLQVP